MLFVGRLIINSYAWNILRSLSEKIGITIQFNLKWTKEFGMNVSYLVLSCKWTCHSQALHLCFLTWKNNVLVLFHPEPCLTSHPFLEALGRGLEFTQFLYGQTAPGFISNCPQIQPLPQHFSFLIMTRSIYVPICISPLSPLHDLPGNHNGLLYPLATKVNVPK